MEFEQNKKLTCASYFYNFPISGCNNRIFSSCPLIAIVEKQLTLSEIKYIRIFKYKSKTTHPTKIPLTRALNGGVYRRQPCRNSSFSLGTTPICVLTTKNFLKPFGNIHINLKSNSITLNTH